MISEFIFPLFIYRIFPSSSSSFSISSGVPFAIMGKLKSLSILKEGGSVRNSFSNLKIYNTRDLNIIDIADSISKSQEGLEKIHNDAEDVLESYLEKMFKLIEPVIMIFIGLLIFSIMYLIIPTILGMIDKITEQ